MAMNQACFHSFETCWIIQQSRFIANYLLYWEAHPLLKLHLAGAIFIIHSVTDAHKY